MNSSTLFRLLALGLLYLCSATCQAINLYPQNVYKIVCNPGLCIGVVRGNHYEQGRIVDALPYDDNSAYQQWQFFEISTGVYTIMNRDSHQYMTYDVSRNVIVQQPFYGQSTQLWLIDEEPANSSNYKIRSSSASPSLVVEERHNNYTDIGNARTYGLSARVSAPNSVNRYQSFSIIDVSLNFGSPNYAVYQLISEHSGKALGAEPSASNNIVQQSTPYGLSYQEWTVRETTNGYYTILNRKNMRALEIGGDQEDWAQPGTKADIWYPYAYDGQHPNQEWAFLDGTTAQLLTIDQVVNGRVFKLYNRYSGKVLEIGGAGLNDGDTANQWYDYGHPWQKWHMSFTSTNRTAQPSSSELPLDFSAMLPADKKVAARTGDLGKAVVAPNKLEVYPTPAQEALWLALPGDVEQDECTVSVVDSRGSEVAVRYQAGKVEVEALPPGIYFVRVRTKSRLYQQRFTKK